MPDHDVFDVIVVGAGTGGCVLASRIAENGINPTTGDRLKVALFEGGSDYMRYHQGVKVGGPFRPGVGDPWRRRIVTNIRQDETSIHYWHYDGFNVKAVGGCSLHWGSHSTMPTARDFYNWNKETDVGWSEEKFKEAVAEAIKMFHVEPLPVINPERAMTAGGGGGPKLSKAGQMFAEPATAMGLKVNQPTDPRDKLTRGEARVNCLNCGYCGRGHYCKYDSKRTGLWYLELIGEPNGLQVIADAEVDHVILAKKGASVVAKGIAYTKDGQKREARAPRVIVSASTTGTPLVLYQSGYGPKDLLGQKLVVENDNVGRHLTGDVAGLSIMLAFGEDIHGGEGRGASIRLHDEDDGARNQLDLSGVRGIAYTIYPNARAFFPVAPDFGREHKNYMKTLTKRVGTVGFHMGRLKWEGGRVGLGGDHLYRRKDDPTIMGLFQKHWPVAQEIVRKMDPKPIKVYDPGPQQFNCYHEMGTCRAGASRKNSVVTPDFDCHDIEGLMIGSGAVIPVDTNTSHMSIVTVSCYAWRRIVANHFTRGAAPLKL